MSTEHEHHRRAGSAGPGRPGRCQTHQLSQDWFIPQLERLLRTGAARDQRVYDSLVIQIVSSQNPLELFDESQRRPGVYLIEALYRIEVERAAAGDDQVALSLPPLSYSRWVAWRRFAEAVKEGSIGFGRGVGGYLARSRQDLVGHVRSGWQPLVLPVDDEFIELLLDC